MRKHLYITTITLLLIGLTTSCQDAEDKAWNDSLNHHSIGAIDSFLSIYPDSKYQEEATQEKDKYAWYVAKGTNTVYGYKKYLADYPQGVHKEDVISQLDAIPVQEISLADLTESTFVGRINYGNRETQIITFKFAEIIEEDKTIRFFAKINTSDIRKDLEGQINKKDYSIMFMENPANKIVLNLTDGRIYKKNNKLMIESTNISQYWQLIKYNK